MEIIAEQPVSAELVTPISSSHQVSPDWVRLSGASAMALRLASGRFSRDFEFGGINLLLNYDEGCLSDCAYCGLARTRPGNYEDKSFIRVDWPLVETNLLAERMAEHEAKLTRLCISMVTHAHAFRDTVDITERIARKVDTPMSILVAPPTLNHDRLRTLKEVGVDMIGIGLDAVTEELFRQKRTDVPKGGLKWENYWNVVEWSRQLFGPWKVNCHTLVGLGETDRDMADMFFRLKRMEVFSYLFNFNPEPDSRMGDQPVAPLTRWRRIQLMKTLIEEHDLPESSLTFDDAGALCGLKADSLQVEGLIGTVAASGTAFMTDGCPSSGGEPGCTRPYGSYKPSDPYRDYPFEPNTADMRAITRELRLDELLRV
jgi:lipoyl synthase